jgi:hypothetical protein
VRIPVVEPTVSEKESDPTARGGQPAPAGDGDPEIGIRQIRDSGDDQPHGSRETSDFAQDEPFRNAAHCRIKAGLVPIVNEYM